MNEPFCCEACWRAKNCRVPCGSCVEAVEKSDPFPRDLDEKMRDLDESYEKLFPPKSRA